MSLVFNTGGVNFSGAIKSTGLQLVNANGVATVDLSNLSANVSNLQTLTTTHSSQISSLQSLTSTHTSQISSINSTILTLESIADFQGFANVVTANINYIQSEVTQLQANAVALAQTIAQTSANLSSIESTDVYSLNQSINSERTARQSDISNVTALINTETSARQSDISNVNASISQEASARQSDIANLNTSINSVVASQIANINANISSLSTSVNSTLSSQISALQSQEQSDIANVNASISSLSSGVYSALSSNVSSLTTLINNETSARQSSVATLTSSISSEASTRASAVSTVTALINTEISDRQNAVSSLNTSLTNSLNSSVSGLYSALSSNVSTLNSSISGVYSALSSNVSTLNTSIATKFDKSGGNITGNVAVSGGISSGNSSIYASLLNGTLQISDGANVMTITPTQISVVTPSNVAGTTQFTPFNLSNLNSGSSSASFPIVQRVDPLLRFFMTCEGGTLQDLTGNYALNNNFNWSASTTQAKYGSYSAYNSSNAPANRLEFKMASPNQYNSCCFPAPQDFTVEFWMYNTNYGTGCSLLQIGQGSSGFDVWLMSNYIRIRNGNGTVLNTSVLSSNITSYNNTWKHVAIMRKSGAMFVWFDGVLYSGWTNAQFDVSINQYLYVGGYQDQSQNSFSGYIDQVEINAYAKYPLTTNISYTYLGQTYTPLPTSGSYSVGQVITNCSLSYICTSTSPLAWVRYTF